MRAFPPSSKAAIAAFAVAAIAAYVPIVLFVFGIHTDYDQLYYKSYHFIFREAPQLFSVARPIAALLSNITLLPISTLAGLRWYRCFSLFSFIVIGTQTISICTSYLRVRASDAVAVACCLLLVPGLYYAAKSAAAWVPHIGAIWFGVCCYAILSRTNAQSIPFYVYARRFDWREGARFLLSYAGLRPVLAAAFLLQCGLYDYPTNALAVCIFPVIVALFSEAPLFYSALLCIRDLSFIAVNLFFYFISVKLLYFPLMKLVYPINVFPAVGPTSEYHFGLASNFQEVWVRFLDVLRVSGNLWFLPQYRFWMVSLIAVAIACLMAAGHRMLSKEVNCENGSPILLGLREDDLVALLRVGVVAVAFIFAAFPVIASTGGRASYRTVAIPTVIACVAFVFCIHTIGTLLGRFVSLESGRRVADAAVAAIALIAVATTFYHVSITVRLSQNEFAYASGIVRDALRKHVTTLVVLDDRDTFFPEDVTEASDIHGHPTVPYELGCFSLNCFSSKPIYMEALLGMGRTTADLDIEIIRGKIARGVSCADFAHRDNDADVSADGPRSFAAMVAARGPVYCVNYAPIWRDLDFKPS